LGRDEGYQQTGKKDAEFVPMSAVEQKEIVEQFKSKKLKKDKK
jgi:hypothetical protein